MIQTITIDVINEKAMNLLHDLELLQLIHMHKEKDQFSDFPNANWAVRYKGTMSKQPLAEIDNQLNELRNGWE